MKRFFISALVLSAIVACSDDDGPTEKCNCMKIIATYNEEAEVFEPISSEYYSDNCADEKTTYNEVGDGTYYSINCTPQE